MNALRNPASTLKLLTLSWRPPPVNPAMCRIRVCKYSSVTKPEEASESTKQPDNIDPFGIGEVMGSSDKSNVLVQGFYPKTEEETTATPQPIKTDLPSPPTPPPSSEKATAAVGEDTEKRNRLSLYDNWLKQRVNIDAAQRSDIGVAESYREAHFGTVRVDKDNPVRSHGMYDTHPGYSLRADPHIRRDRRRRAVEVEDNEPMTETIEADHSVRVRASEFLKQIRQKEMGTTAEQEEDDMEGMRRREKLIIERIASPRKSTREEPPSTREEALTQDSNKIPKEYFIPNYNALLKEDMWNILSKTVLFQNDFIFAIHKPYGVPVHSKARDCRHTIIQFLDQFAELAKCKKIYPLHRIDKETTGVLLFAKDPKVASIIKEKFANRQVKKVYLAVAKMCPKVSEGQIKIPIGEGLIPGTEKYRQVLRPDLRDYGIKPSVRHCVEAITDFRVISSIKEASFLEIEPVTGYKHQIRVHLGMGLGCPVLGDHKYSHRDKLAPQRLHPFVLHQIKVKQSKVREIPLHLHCKQISFTLPPEFTNNSEPVHIQANIPFFMKYTLKRLKLIR